MYMYICTYIHIYTYEVELLTLPMCHITLGQETFSTYPQSHRHICTNTQHIQYIQLYMAAVVALLDGLLSVCLSLSLSLCMPVIIFTAIYRCKFIHFITTYYIPYIHMLWLFLLLYLFVTPQLLHPISSISIQHQ